MDGPVDLRTDLIISKDATEVGEEDICWLALGAVLGIAAAITARVEPGKVTSSSRTRFDM